QYNFVPVFWLGSEDHDKDELCHTFVDETKIDWQTEQTGTVGRFALDGLREKIEELKSLTHVDTSTSSVPELLNVLENALSQNIKFAELTQYLATELFKDFGLVVLNPDNADLKRLYAPIIEDEILSGRARIKLFQNLQWLEENYSVQAQPRDINFFYLTDNSRERIVRTDEGFTTANNAHSFTEEELKNELREHPERFSPNVFFRPLYQEFILPNLAFIGGGGELSYWLELKPLFDYHNIPFPMLIHRSMGAILKQNNYEKAEKLKLNIRDFFAEKQVLIKQWITENTQHDISIEEEKKKLDELYETLLQKAIAIDKTLENSVKAEQQKAINTLENLQVKITKAEKRTQETSLNQIESIYKKLFPNGTLQERSENVLALAFRLSKEELNELILAQNPFDKTFRFFSY
ncbi:MAG TPA: bacillithiol biosynthesis cysteine-adding enzyme BshC, partial [Chitinophagales bacterium]